MIDGSDDVVKVAVGTLAEINEQAGRLHADGVRCRVVGDDITAGLGTMIPGSVELWVLAADADRAAAILSGEFDAPDRPKFPHPTSDPKPDRGDGPHHFPTRHRPSN
ncbi:MAG: hypothetical protein KF873_22165 [Gemmataceae bacterium]|nr:hypothetical protein [Gemmataceae bacterium]